jgi:hypothetical protein
MKNILKVAVLTTLSLSMLNFGSFAEDKPKAAESKGAVNSSGKDSYQSIKKEFVDYISRIAVSIKDEIKSFRSEIKGLNEAKSQAYKKLSLEAQEFLKQEAIYKKRLYLQQKKDLANEIQEIDLSEKKPY